MRRGALLESIKDLLHPSPDRTTVPAHHGRLARLVWVNRETVCLIIFMLRAQSDAFTLAGSSSTRSRTHNEG